MTDELLLSIGVGLAVGLAVVLVGGIMICIVIGGNMRE